MVTFIRLSMKSRRFRKKSHNAIAYQLSIILTGSRKYKMTKKHQLGQIKKYRSNKRNYN